MLGSEVTGTLSGLSGVIKFDPNVLESTTLDVQVEAASINTGVDMRDAHLKEEEYFHVTQFPSIQFISRKVLRANRKNTFFVYGTLKIKGISKDISFPFTATPLENGFWLNGQFRINRRDFKVGESSLTLSDIVVVTLNVKAEKNL